MQSKTDPDFEKDYENYQRSNTKECIYCGKSIWWNVNAGYYMDENTSARHKCSPSGLALVHKAAIRKLKGEIKKLKDDKLSLNAQLQWAKDRIVKLEQQLDQQ